MSGQASVSSELDDEDEDDVPEEVEAIAQDLLEALRDDVRRDSSRPLTNQDVIVRYSAAKHLARTAERLPGSFRDQLVDALVDSFVAHDLSTVSESVWHGACLALAEFARRGALAPTKLPEVLSPVFTVRSRCSNSPDSAGPASRPTSRRSLRRLRHA